MDGVIESLDRESRTGKIRGDRNRVLYFFNERSLKNRDFSELARGQDVIFEEIDDRMRPKAEDVYVI